MNARILSAALAASSLMAQSVDRTKPPQTSPLAPFQLPPVHETTLGNGLRVVLVHDGRFPIVNVRMGFEAGSKFEPAELAGLSEMVAELLKEGAAGKTSRQIAEQLADIGGSLNAASGSDAIMVSGYALSEYSDKLLDLLAGMVRSASFPEEEIALRKQNRKQELAHQRSQPGTLADEKLLQTVFRSHPYSRMLPTVESIDRMKREDLIAFRERFLTPNNGVLVLVGPVGDGKAILGEIESKFGKWEKKAPPKLAVGEIPPPARSLTLVDRPGSVQADFRAGRTAVDRTHADYFPMVMANTIFGSGTSSRMFVKIREEKGFAYDARSSLEPHKTSGLFTAVTQVRNEVVEAALDAVLAELRLMGAEPVSAIELEAAKNFRNGQFALSLETPAGLASQLASLKINGLPNEYLEKYTTRVRAVTPEQVQAAGAKYMNPEALSLVVVGDAETIRGSLKKFGDAQIEKAKP
ncbi:MAG: insulinase family protein [Bryobacteraceae bacterium]|nr:insulinase family protein [Bryobacteraceae bacterium]